MKTTGSYLPIQQASSSKKNILSYNIMLKTGMIRQHSKGLYSWLPFGTLILRKIENIIRETLNSYGMQECIMPCLQDANLWKSTNRYDAYGKETFRIHDRYNKELLLAPTAEDLITEICKPDIKSYKQLPIKLYQIHWKFRDEIRPKNGAMRSREFMMKDGYSFDINEETMNQSYKTICKAYHEIFNIKLGLNTILNTAENGPIGGNLSHEVSIASPIGENLLEIAPKYLEDKKLSFEEWYSLHAKDIDKDKDKDTDKDIIQDADKKLTNAKYTTTTSTEIGHIFAFDQKYTQLLNFKVSNSDNKSIYPYMTSFGIGVTRLVQILVEKYYKNEQLSLPAIINPFKFTIIDRNKNNENGEKLFQSISQKITKDILFDDTNNQDIKSKINHHKLLGAYAIIILSNDGKHADIIDNQHTEIKKNININNIHSMLINKLKMMNIVDKDNCNSDKHDSKSNYK